jgi:hypothetical protein
LLRGAQQYGTDGANQTVANSMPRITNTEQARQALRQQNRFMIQTHRSESGDQFSLENGDTVPPRVARQLRQDSLEPSGDGLFPGHSQTYKLRLAAPRAFPGAEGRQGNDHQDEDSQLQF